MITYLFSRRFEQYFFSQPVLHFFLPLAATSAITYLSFNLGPIFFLKTYIIHIQARRNIRGRLGFVPTIFWQLHWPFSNQGGKLYPRICMSQPTLKPFHWAWIYCMHFLFYSVLTRLCRWWGQKAGMRFRFNNEKWLLTFTFLPVEWASHSSKHSAKVGLYACCYTFGVCAIQL